MMRSFAYAAYSAVDRIVAVERDEDQAIDRAAFAGWARHWQDAATAQFLFSYREGIEGNPKLLPPPKETQILLDAYLLCAGFVRIALTSWITDPRG